MLKGHGRRLVATLLCISLSISFISCTSKANKKEESAISSVSQTSAQSPNFVTRLTANGTGLVRNVPACSCSSFVTKPSISSHTFDIRWLDCPKYLDGSQLQKLKASIPNISFNSETVWPKDMPSSYNYSAIMETGKKPGLGLDTLHHEGITGKGSSIAIIDQGLFTGHPEYKDNLALYEEIHVTPDESASMHGSGVSSIAVGKTCGVAPDAKLYYWAVNLVKDPSNKDASDKSIAFADGLAVAIDRMLKVNTALPENKKIRVLSISRGFSDSKDTGVQTFLEAVKRAQKAGIFVITTGTSQYSDFMSYDTDFAGLAKINLTGNPDDLSTYTLGRFEQSNPDTSLNKLLIPMDDRTTADPSGAADYAFYSEGGMSWAVPYLAGVYALAVQVKPSITPQVFWKMALNTSSKLTVTINRKQYTFNHVINPVKLIHALK